VGLSKEVKYFKDPQRNTCEKAIQGWNGEQKKVMREYDDVIMDLIITN
jgi:hypothetical protein